jgi:hypothetical protein
VAGTISEEASQSHAAGVAPRGLFDRVGGSNIYVL